MSEVNVSVGSIRDRVEPTASSPMSAMPPQARIVNCARAEPKFPQRGWHCLDVDRRPGCGGTMLLREKSRHGPRVRQQWPDAASSAAAVMSGSRQDFLCFLGWIFSNAFVLAESGRRQPGRLPRVNFLGGVRPSKGRPCYTALRRKPRTCRGISRRLSLDSILHNQPKPHDRVAAFR